MDTEEGIVLIKKEFKYLKQDNKKGKIPLCAFKQAEANIIHILKECEGWGW